MADTINDISSITLPNGSKYSFKDSVARLSCEQLLSDLLEIPSTYAQLSDVSKVFIKDSSSAGYEDGKQSDLSVIKLTEDEYAQMLHLSSVEPNALYVISCDSIDAYGMQIKNLSAGTDLSDAVNLEQLQAVSSAIPLSTSQLENDSGFLSAHQSLSNYWTKSETSSASELSDKFTGYWPKTDTSSSTELQSAFNNIYVKTDTSSASQISGALSSKADLSSIPTDLSSFTNSPGYLASMLFAGIQNPKYTVNSICDTLISILNILRRTT